MSTETREVHYNSRLGKNTEENLKVVNKINSKGSKLQVNGKKMIYCQRKLDKRQIPCVFLILFITKLYCYF